MEQRPEELDGKIEDMRGLYLTVSDTTKLFFVSDLHFMHRKMCSSYPEHFDVVRKYATIEEMDDDIIRSWNATIGDNDIVVFLGDLIMNVPVKQVAELSLNFWNQLHGIKYFIKGNHDGIVKSKLKHVIDFYDFAELIWHGKTYYAQHRTIGHEEGSNPYMFNAWLAKSPRDIANTVIVHGHTHSSNKYSKTGRADFRLQNCVCWDVAYAPIPADHLGSADMTLVGECAGHQIVAHMEK